MTKIALQKGVAGLEGEDLPAALSSPGLKAEGSRTNWMNTKEFVFEIGVEEIPSRYVKDVSRELHARMSEALQDQRLFAQALTARYTPRRLVVYGAVAATQKPKTSTIRGPRLEVAYRDHLPTPALEGFLRRASASLADLQQEIVDQKTYLSVARREPERNAESVLAEVASQAFLAMNLPRSMRWGSGEARFVRPIRWLGLWLEDQPLSLSLAGIQSGSVSYGNRTDHPEPLAITSAAQYPTVMETVLKVVLDQDVRKAIIRQQGSALAKQAGGFMEEDDGLLEEVAALVEWPVPFLGQFDGSFLDVPEPILTTAMKVHQRYFPMRDHQGRLLPAFIGVRNGVGRDLDKVRHGNEKVLRARLNDADYFYRQDIKIPLSSRARGLAEVVFHAKLGTYADKVGRLRALFLKTKSLWVLADGEAHEVERAIDLAKCDLLTHVVEEFSELEGIMGGIYAAHDGESEGVAMAISDQYLPRQQGDPVPRNRVGAVLGLLDRLDTLIMAFAHGIQPTGSEDPFGLRRSALGIARIWTETDVAREIELNALLSEAKALYQLSQLETEGPRELVVSRLKSHWAEEVPAEVIDALLAVDGRLASLRSRIALWRDLSHQEDRWASYLMAFKRVDRVLGEWTSESLAERYQLDEEERLAQEIRRMNQTAEIQSWWQAVPEMVSALAELFEAVLIMDANQEVRQSRLNLLAKARSSLSRYWDPGKLPS